MNGVYDPNNPLAQAFQSTAVANNYQANPNPGLYNQGYSPIMPSNGVLGPSQTYTAGIGGVSQQNNPSFFSQGGGAGLALSGIQTIGSLWSAFQQNKLAKKALNFQKDSFNINLGNSVKQYNTALEDRIRARYNTEGRSDQADAKIARDKLPSSQI